MEEEGRAEQAPVDVSIDAIDHLSRVIGPRAPTSEAERRAAEWFKGELEAIGLKATVERFPAYRSFGRLYIPIFILALLASVRRLGRVLRVLASLAAAFIGYREGEFKSVGRMEHLFRGSSQNVYGVIEPEGDPERTLCLVCHLDSSRSGLMFHPAVTPYLGSIVAGVSALVGANALLTASGRLRRLAGMVRLMLAGVLGLVVERELRGEDVPGANDNASGAGACLALAGALAEGPLERTRVVVLATGAEEAGVLGMRHFLDTHDTEGWVFLNFDGVGAKASLRYLRVEGGPLSPRRADPEMVALVDRLGREIPELGISDCDHGSGLPYDSTAVIARGGRALTLTAQDRSIPDYHWPSDLPERIDRLTVEKVLRLAQEMLAEIDRGAVDRA